MNDTFAETHIYTRDLRRILNSGGTNHCNGPIPANSASFLQANCPLPKKRSKRPSVGIVVRLGHHLARISVSFRRQLNKGTRNTQMFFSGVFFFTLSLPASEPPKCASLSSLLPRTRENGASRIQLGMVWEEKQKIQTDGQTRAVGVAKQQLNEQEDSTPSGALPPRLSSDHYSVTKAPPGGARWRHRIKRYVEHSACARCFLAAGIGAIVVWSAVLTLVAAVVFFPSGTSP